MHSSKWIIGLNSKRKFKNYKLVTVFLMCSSVIRMSSFSSNAFNYKLFLLFLTNYYYCRLTWKIHLYIQHLYLSLFWKNKLLKHYKYREHSSVCLTFLFRYRSWPWLIRWFVWSSIGVKNVRRLLLRRLMTWLSI